MRRSRELLFNIDTQKLELLLTPLNRLGLQFEGSPLEAPVRVAMGELRQAGIRKLEPYFYLSTGYGTVASTTSIALGFYDCHPVLKLLNRETRGFEYSFEDQVDLVRHELGHAFAYAYKLYRRKDFRAMFNVRGNYFNTYPATNRYIERANPWSRDFVNPSGDHYAQKHPDDDFAETFCVWLRPRPDWQHAYRRFPGALRKLEFVDSIVDEVRRDAPAIDQKPYLFEPLEEFPLTVRQFFKITNTRPYRLKASGYIDNDLFELFWQSPSPRNLARRRRDYVLADNFVRKHKRTVEAQVSRWTGVDHQVVKDLLDKCSARARALDLWVRKDQREKQLVEFTSYVSYRCALYALNESYLNGASGRH